MGFATKFQFNAPTLLVASGFLLAMQWLLPAHVPFCRLILVIACLVVFRAWSQWGRLHGVIPNAGQLINLKGSNRTRAMWRGAGFLLLLGCWLVAAAMPESIANFFHPPAVASSDLARAIAVTVLLAVLVGFAVLPIMTNIRNYRNAARAISKSVEDRLDELERLKRRDMVTPEEYAAKRQEILKDL